MNLESGKLTIMLIALETQQMKDILQTHRLLLVLLITRQLQIQI